jgi:hypothetical protein
MIQDHPVLMHIFCNCKHKLPLKKLQAQTFICAFCRMIKRKRILIRQLWNGSARVLVKGWDQVDTCVLLKPCPILNP